MKKNVIIKLILIALLVIHSSCGGGNGGDSVSLEVESHYPDQNIDGTVTSTDIQNNGVTATFNEPVRAETINNSSFRVEWGPRGIVSLAVNVSEVRTGTDNTPADPFEDPSVVLNSLMNDGDLSQNAYTVVTNSASNIIRIALNGNNIDHLYLYTVTDIGAAAAGTLTWTAYTNDILGTSWDVVPLQGVTYNSNMRRFEIDLGDHAIEYLKLVIDIPLLGPIINFTEVQAMDEVLLVRMYSGSVTYENFGRVARFTPDSALLPGYYLATVTKDVTDLVGNGLAEEYTWSFRVGTSYP